MTDFRKIILVMLLFIAATSLSAIKDNSYNSIGLHFGTSSGNGYAMRWMGEQLGFQITLGASTKGSNKVKFPDSYYDYSFDYTPDINDEIWVKKTGRSSTGTMAINGILMLDHFNSGRIYIMGGGSVKNGRKSVFSSKYRSASFGTNYNRYDKIIGKAVKREEKDIYEWTVGFGPGVELSFTRHFRIAFEVPITYNDRKDIIMYIPQVGLYYYLK